jgi:hypothetical protein
MGANEMVAGWLRRHPPGSKFNQDHVVPDPYSIGHNVIDMTAWSYARAIRDLDAANQAVAFAHGQDIAAYRARKKERSAASQCPARSKATTVSSGSKAQARPKRNAKKPSAKVVNFDGSR